jgi:hypothetical protein
MYITFFTVALQLAIQHTTLLKKIARVYAMKAYNGIRGTAPLILNLVPWLPYRQGQSTQYQQNMRLGDPTAGLDILVDSKNLMP